MCIVRKLYICTLHRALNNIISQPKIQVAIMCPISTQRSPAISNLQHDVRPGLMLQSNLVPFAFM